MSSAKKKPTVVPQSPKPSRPSGGGLMGAAARNLIDASSTAEELEDKQGLMDDLRKLVTELDSHLECAETCETMHDFRANIDEAIDAVRRLQVELKEVQES
jgi:hypothetical protein